MSTYQVVAPVAVRPLWSGRVIVSAVGLMAVALVRVAWKLPPDWAPAFAATVAERTAAAESRVRASAERRRLSGFIRSPLIEERVWEQRGARQRQRDGSSGFAAGGVVGAEDVVDAVEEVVEVGAPPGHRGEGFVVDAAVGFDQEEAGLVEAFRLAVTAGGDEEAPVVHRVLGEAVADGEPIEVPVALALAGERLVVAADGDDAEAALLELVDPA